MSFLSRFRILTKIVSVIALLGVMMVGSTWYVTGRMTHINDAYSRFLDKDARSWATVGRFNRSITACSPRRMPRPSSRTRHY